MVRSAGCIEILLYVPRPLDTLRQILLATYTGNKNGLQLIESSNQASYQYIQQEKMKFSLIYNINFQPLKLYSLKY